MFLQALPHHVQELLRRLGRLPAIAPFYLAGGSAIALHLGHRISVDLDFFTAQEAYEVEPLAVGAILFPHQHSSGEANFQNSSATSSKVFASASLRAAATM